MATLIAVLAGDGIGPEIMREAVRALEAVAELGGHKFAFTEALIGGAAIDATGDSLPDDTARLCADADAVLLGAVGGPKWSDPNASIRPEQGLLSLRSAMGVYANLRPVKTHPALYASSPLKPGLLQGVDILVVRELTGGIYFGERQRDENSAMDVCRYERSEIERVVRMAAEFARQRRGKITSVDKANVLDTSRLWRSITEEIIGQEFNDVALEHLLVDAATMHLLSRPADFDVIVTENMFGDILTDEASMLCGSLGMLPSASLNQARRGLFEPIHGSAPDIAGRGIANPCGMILSAALLLRYGLGLQEESDRLERAVFDALQAGYRTADLTPVGQRSVSTADMGEAILKRFKDAA